MATRLIELKGHTLVEIEVPAAQAQQIASGVTEKVDAAQEKIGPILHKICRSVAESWKDLRQDFRVDEAEVELGLSFEADGIHRLMGHYEAVLTDFNRALELDDNISWVFPNRGEVNRVMGKYEAALADFNRAIDLDDKTAWVIASRGDAMV